MTRRVIPFPSPPPAPEEISLSLDILDALTPEGVGEKLVLKAEDDAGLVTRADFVKREKQPPERQK